MYKVEKKNRVLRIPDEKFDEYKKMGYIIRDENDNVLFEPENIKATAEKLKKENDELKAKLEEATLYAENADKKIAELQKKQNADTSALTDGSKASETGTPVYYVSNLHAGKEFYLDSLKGNYQLTFSDDFASVMNEIEAEYKEKNKLL